MTDKKETVAYFVFEGEMTRMERTNHRLWILCILLLLTLVGTNAGWLYYESQWETVSETTITQEAEAYGESDIKLHAIGDEDGGQSETDSND